MAMGCGRWCTVLGVACAVVLRATLAVAQPCDDEAAVRHGFEHTDAQRYEDALAEFTRAWAQCHAPRARAQMALAEQRLGIWLAADAHLREALGATSDPWVRPRRPALEAALATIATRIGQLQVRANVPGAEVRIDGRVIATLPMAAPVRVVAGIVTVAVGAPGHVTVMRSVTVQGGGLALETVELVAAAPEPVGPRVMVTAPAVDAPGDRVGPGGATNGGGGGGVNALLVLGGVGVGVGVALVGGGIAGLVLRDGHVADFARQGCVLDVTSGTVQGGGMCSGIFDAGNTEQAVAIAGFVAGGAIGIASVLLLALAPRTAPRERGAAAHGRPVVVRCGWGPGQAGLACGGSF